jgi:Putative Actinobacterial Holin-X, holin superfamily III
MSTEYTPARATDDESTSVVGAAREGYQSSRAAMEAEDGRSIGQILGDVSRDVSTLMRQEVALAKAEARQSATQAGKGVGMLVGAGVAGVLCLVFISLSAAVGLGQFIGEGAQPSGVQWGALIVAIVWAIIAAILLTVGRSELKRVRGLQQTTDTLGKVPNALKGHEEDNR